MRILFVSPYMPSPIRVRPYEWIRALARLGHRVRLVALRPPEDEWLNDVPVREHCESVTVFPISRLRTVANAVWAVPRRRLPLQAAYSHLAEAERFIAEEARYCDVIHVEHLRGAVLVRRVVSEDVTRVIDAVDSITALFEHARHQAPSLRHRLMAGIDLGRTRAFEAGFVRRFDRVIVSAAGDARRFQALGGTEPGHPVGVLPNGVDLERFHPVEQSTDCSAVLFTGKMSYHANAAAALRLVKHVMPLVWRKRPEIKVVVAGKDPGPEVQQLAQDSRVTVTKYVTDLRPLFWNSALVAAPLVYGAGIQNKVLEAMACGIAVVASPQACEALSAARGQDLLVGSTDEEMATHIIALLENRSLRRQVGMRGRAYVAVQHDWTRLARRLVGVYEGARAERRPQA